MFAFKLDTRCFIEHMRIQWHIHIAKSFVKKWHTLTCEECKNVNKWYLNEKKLVSVLFFSGGYLIWT